MEENREWVEALSVMVTGATSPVGLALVDRLLKDERIVHVLAVGLESPSFVSKHSVFQHERCTYQQVDLTRTRQVRRLLFGVAREREVDAILHTAQHRLARDSGKRVHQLNVEATRTLMQLAEEHPTIRRFVFRSYGEMYRVTADLPDLIEETHPLALSSDTPQWLRDRIEADLTVSAWMGLSRLHVVVLRCAECLTADTGSQLYDYFSSRVCFRPAGYDPMLNLLSLRDLIESLCCALFCECQGTFNIPGKDTLPLSAAIQLAGCTEVPVPGPLLAPLYWARAKTRGGDFRYDLNRWRFHFNGVLDGRRAAQRLGYVPQHSIDWSLIGQM